MSEGPTITAEPTIRALCPWFGSNRLGAELVGEQLTGCEWVGIPLAGGMSELLHVKARALVVNDQHRHVINLARVLADENDGPRLIAVLREQAFHPDTLANAQANCIAWEEDAKAFSPLAAAWSYFICCWMGRSGLAGTDKEFTGKLPVRWSASGGDSNTRYRSAVESLRAWRQIMVRCNFTCMDAFEFLEECQDNPKHGIYLDPPFPGPGDAYKHKLDEVGQGLLAEALHRFQKARIVCRYYDHPLIRRLYPEGEWTWLRWAGRKQTNDAAPEVLLRKN